MDNLENLNNIFKELHTAITIRANTSCFGVTCDQCPFCKVYGGCSLAELKDIIDATHGATAKLEPEPEPQEVAPAEEPEPSEPSPTDNLAKLRNAYSLMLGMTDRTEESRDYLSCPMVNCEDCPFGYDHEPGNGCGVITVMSALRKMNGM